MPERAHYVAGTPCWVDLTTVDLDAAKAFYGGVFDWEFDTGPEEYGFYTSCTKDGRAVAAMMPRQPDTDSPQRWNTYLATDDIDDTVRRATEAGGSVVFGPMEVPEQGKVAYLVDPTGAEIALWQGSGFHGAAVVNESDSLSWNELHTPDAQKADEFYARLFPYTFEQIPGDMNYAVLKLGDDMVGGRFQSENEPPNWLVYFSVADADESARKVEEHGGKVVRELQDTPYGRMGAFEDPTGATFALTTPPGS